MAEESFLLVNLKENKSKELANVISNETSRLILDFLSKKNATETDVAKELKLPISTVHYNLQNLLKAGLVKADEFHYSEKGKEVNHYKLSNKFIIIAPTITETIKDRLRKILPAGLIALATAGFIQLYSYLNQGFLGKAAAPANAVIKAAEAPMMDALKAEGAEAVSAPVTEAVITAAKEPNIALWFLFGALFVTVVYLIAGFIRSKK